MHKLVDLCVVIYGIFLKRIIYCLLLFSPTVELRATDILAATFAACNGSFKMVGLRFCSIWVTKIWVTKLGFYRVEPMIVDSRRAFKHYCVFVCCCLLHGLVMDLDFLIACNMCAYVVLNPFVSVRKLTVCSVFTIWHISRIGNADARCVLSIIFVSVRLNLCCLCAIWCIRAVFSSSVVTSLFALLLFVCVRSVYLLILLWCPFKRVFSLFLVIPMYAILQSEQGIL